jgi:hypothetical protein
VPNKLRAITFMADGSKNGVRENILFQSVHSVRIYHVIALPQKITFRMIGAVAHLDPVRMLLSARDLWTIASAVTGNIFSKRLEYSFDIERVFVICGEWGYFNASEVGATFGAEGRVFNPSPVHIVESFRGRRGKFFLERGRPVILEAARPPGPPTCRT